MHLQLGKVNLESVKRCCVLLGAFLIQLSIGIPFLFGSYVTYMTSYMHMKGFYNRVNIGDENWIISPFCAAMALSMCFSNFFVQRCGVRVTVFISSLFFTSGYMLTYYTIQHSIVSASLSYGVLCGLGAGVSYVCAVDLALQWFPDNRSTVTAILFSGFCLCGVVFSYLVTLVINPLNLSTNIMLGSERVFGQKEITDQVPNTFLLLGAIKFILQLIGSLFCFPPPATTYEKLKPKNGQVEEGKKSENKTNGGTKDLSTLQVLKDPWAYVILGMVLFLMIADFSVNIMYKNFGQTFIKDDMYLVTVGSTAVLMSVCYRVVVGIFADKYGEKLVHMFSTCIACALMMTFHLTKHMDRGWFMVWVSGLYCTLTSTYVVIVVIIRDLYGSKHFASNYSLIVATTGISALIVPVIISNLIKSVGWEFVTMSLGIITLMGFILSFLLPVPLCHHFSKLQGEDFIHD